jgi:hypothetical protein
MTLDRKKCVLVTCDKLFLFQFSETKIHANGDVLPQGSTEVKNESDTCVLAYISTS